MAQKFWHKFHGQRVGPTQYYLLQFVAERGGCVNSNTLTIFAPWPVSLPAAWRLANRGILKRVSLDEPSATRQGRQDGVWVYNNLQLTPSEATKLELAIRKNPRASEFWVIADLPQTEED